MAYTVYVPAILVACSVCSVALRDLISPTENICHFIRKISPTFHTKKYLFYAVSCEVYGTPTSHFLYWFS